MIKPVNLSNQLLKPDEVRHFKRELLRRTLAPGESEQTVRAMEEAGYIQVKDGLVFPIKL